MLPNKDGAYLTNTQLVYLGNGSLVITTDLAQSARLLLYNTAGQLVVDGGVVDLLAGENHVDLVLGQLSASLYFVVIMDGQSQRIAQLKIVKS